MSINHTSGIISISSIPTDIPTSTPQDPIRTQMVEPIDDNNNKKRALEEACNHLKDDEKGEGLGNPQDGSRRAKNRKMEKQGRKPCPLNVQGDVGEQISQMNTSGRNSRERRKELRRRKRAILPNSYGTSQLDTIAEDPEVLLKAEGGLMVEVVEDVLVPDLGLGGSSESDMELGADITVAEDVMVVEGEGACELGGSVDIVCEGEGMMHMRDDGELNVEGDARESVENTSSSSPSAHLDLLPPPLSFSLPTTQVFTYPTSPAKGNRNLYRQSAPTGDTDLSSSSNYKTLHEQSDTYQSSQAPTDSHDESDTEDAQVDSQSTTCPIPSLGNGESQSLETQDTQIVRTPSPEFREDSVGNERNHRGNIAKRGRKSVIRPEIVREGVLMGNDGGVSGGSIEVEVGIAMGKQVVREVDVDMEEEDRTGSSGGKAQWAEAEETTAFGYVEIAREFEAGGEDGDGANDGSDGGVSESESDCESSMESEYGYRLVGQRDLVGLDRGGRVLRSRRAGRVVAGDVREGAIRFRVGAEENDNEHKDDDDGMNQGDSGSETEEESESESEYEYQDEGDDEEDMEEDEEPTKKKRRISRGVEEDSLTEDDCDNHHHHDEDGEETNRELEDSAQIQLGGIGYETDPLCYTPQLPAQRSMTELPNLAQHFSMLGGITKGVERIIAAVKENPQIKGASLIVNVPKRHVVQLGHEKQVEHERRCGVFKERIAVLGLEFVENCCVHAVHTTNLASPDAGIREQSKQSIRLEMNTLSMMGLKILVIHVGSNKQGLADTVFNRLVNDLQDILDEERDVVLAMENMTGRCAGETSTDLPTLKRIISAVNRPGRLKVCLDLCHIYNSSFDLFTRAGRDAFWEDVDILGARNIAAIHVSDSYIRHGGTGDRHANLGFGMIGLKAIREILRSKRFAGIPTILESPPYFKGFRATENSEARYLQMWRAERIRSWNELSMLWAVLQASDDDFEDYQKIETGWKAYAKTRHALECRINMGVRDPEMGIQVQRKFAKYRSMMASVIRRAKSWKTSRADRIKGLTGRKKYNTRKRRVAVSGMTSLDPHPMRTRSRK